MLRPESTIRTAVKDQESTGAIIRNIPKVEVPDTPLRLAPGFKEDHDLHLQEPGLEGNVMLWGFLVIIGSGVVVVLIYIMQIAAILPSLAEEHKLREDAKGAEERLEQKDPGKLQESKDKDATALNGGIPQ